MAKTIKAGVIGAGILGSQHASFLHGHAATQVLGVADLRAEVAQKVAAQAQATAYTDYREMLRAQPLDLVVVATPDPLHREPTLAALEAGVPNIILEKPLATTVADAEAIYEAVEKHKARLFVNFANRAVPTDAATRYVIQQGLIGPVMYGESRLDDNITVPLALWGDRSREWAGASSTAHFLLSHVVDLLRWYFTPAEVTEVFGIVQKKVLGFTPDVYDAFLTFNNGAKVRVKAEWIKHIDELVEFYMCFSGATGTVIYNKRAGFGGQTGWRANLDKKLTPEQLLAHQTALLKYDANLKAILHRPSPSAGQLAAGGGELTPALEYIGPCSVPLAGMVGPMVDAILEDTLEPKSWAGRGPLPNHVDGLQQTKVVAAIIQSSETGRVVEVK